MKLGSPSTALERFKSRRGPTSRLWASSPISSTVDGTLISAPHAEGPNQQPAANPVLSQL
jgi:hypothetical protein